MSIDSVGPLRAIALGSLLLVGCGAGASDTPTKERPLDPGFVSRTERTPEGPLHLVEVPGPGETPILFIHGSPGSWDGWRAYLRAPELAAFGPRIAPDRPGFGASGPGNVDTDLRRQAATLARLLPSGRRSILVGHSLGGPLVAWIARDFPERVCGGVIVAGSVAPGLESPRWYNHAATTALVRRFLPRDMRWSNDEMMGLGTELERLAPEWARLTVPLVVVQGEKDKLVDPRSAEWLAARVPPALLTLRMLPGEGHFVVWERPEVVLDAIRALPCGGGTNSVLSPAPPG